MYVQLSPFAVTETITTLLIGYTPINKKEKFNVWGERNGDKKSLQTDENKTFEKKNMEGGQWFYRFCSLCLFKER